MALAAAAGAAIGIAIGLHEQSLLGAAGLALLLPIARRGDRWRLARMMALSGVLVVALPMEYVWLTQPGYASTVRTWLQGMAHDRALMTFGWSDAGLFLLWILSLGPVVVVAGVSAWTRRSSPVWRIGAALFAVSAPALVQLFVAATFRGINYSPRFLLPAFPGALAIPGAWALDRAVGRSRNQFIAACVMIVFPLVAAAPIVRGRTAATIDVIEALPAMLRTVPPTALIVTGQPCPAISLQQAVLAHDVPSMPTPAWQPVCPGWAWPTDLAARLNDARSSGHPVVVDLRPVAWVGGEQLAARAQADRYVQAAESAGTTNGLIVWR